MRFKPLLVFLFFLLITNLSAAITDIRIAYINPNDNIAIIPPSNKPKATIPEEFLIRAKKNKYTHIMVQYYMNNFFCEPEDWINGKYKGGNFNSGGLYNVIKSHLDLVFKKYGMEFIPLIGVGCSGLSWERDGITKNNPNMDLYALNTGANGVGIPCIAPGQPNGFDTTFEHFARVLNAACDVVEYNLPFINLGYSEAFLDADKTVGNTTYRKGQIIFGTPASNQNGGTKVSIDQQWLNSNNGDTTALVIASLDQKLTTLRKIGERLSSTQIIIYGDLLGDEFQKASDHVNFRNTGYLPTVNMAEQMTQKLKDNIIIMPWWYEEKYTSDGLTVYNNENEYKHFTNNGLRIIYFRALADQDKQSEIPNRIKQFLNSITAAKKHSQNNLIIGYGAAHWNINGYSSSGVTWNAIEFLAYGNQVARPEIKFCRIPQGVINGINIQALLCSKTEITQGDYYAITGNFPYDNYSTGNLNLPAENVTFYDAILYCNARSIIEGFKPVYTYDVPQSSDFNNENCKRLKNLTADTSNNGYRLPSPEEWEFSYMAGTTTSYYWETAPVKNYCWSGSTTQQVGQLGANAFGLKDMAGNVEEMTCTYGTTLSAGYAGGCFSNSSSRRIKHGSNIPLPKRLKSRGANWLGFRIVRKAPAENHQ